MKRRTFIKASAAGAAAVGLGGSVREGVDGSAAQDPAVDEPVLVTGVGVPQDTRQAVDALFPHVLPADNVRLSWTPYTVGSWAAQDIRIASRYVPSPDGVSLAFLENTHPVLQGSAFTMYWRDGQPNAITLDVEEHAVLFNTEKAERLTVRTATLAGLRGTKARSTFLVSPIGSAGVNSWLLPVAADYFDLPNSSERFAEVLGSHGEERLSSLGELLTSVSATVTHDPAGHHQYHQLLDPGHPEVVAVWGSSRLMNEVVSERFRGQLVSVQAVSLQQFLGLSSPTLFPTLSAQVGRFVTSAGASTVAAALAAMRDRGRANRFDFYAKHRHLPHLTDGGFLAQLFVELSTGLAHRNSGTTAGQVATWGVRRAQQRWEQHEMIQAAFPTHQVAAPAPAFDCSRFGGYRPTGPLPVL